jgi:hypothetical protein
MSEDEKFFIEEDAADDTAMDDYLRVNLSRCIAYAESAKPKLQREVAERLANEAVKSHRQVQIVELGGLKLLVPLSQSSDVEVRRLAAHALANLSVNATNQVLMADLGAIEILVGLLETDSAAVKRQSAKALANLSVNIRNKEKVSKVRIPLHFKVKNDTPARKKRKKRPQERTCRLFPTIPGTRHPPLGSTGGSPRRGGRNRGRRSARKPCRERCE